MPKKVKRTIIALECEVCKSRNYSSYKSHNMKEKMSKEKYCNTCKKHTVHKETKI